LIPDEIPKKYNLEAPYRSGSSYFIEMNPIGSKTLLHSLAGGFSTNLFLLTPGAD